MTKAGKSAKSADKASDKRRAKRTRLVTSASVRVKNGRVKQFETITRDVSPAGIYLYSDANLKEGSEIEIVAMLPQDLSQNAPSTWVCCHARVVRVESNNERGRGVAAVIERFDVVPEA